ncbi:WD40 repeat [Trinorchestia longiramus]|nr:WD40 repeat [Trinorchestia longiramus]
MPFFTKANSVASPKPKGRKEKRKANFSREGKAANRLKRRRTDVHRGDEEIESSSSCDEEQLNQIKKFKPEDSALPDSDEEHETAQEKKERLAKEYIKELEDLKAAAVADPDDEEQHSVSMQQQLRNDVLKASGKLHKKVAQNYAPPENHTISILHCKKFQHKTITCIAINPVDCSIFSASLDGSIVKYSITGERLGLIKSFHQDPKESKPRHKGAVFSLAVSSNGKYLASGDNVGMILVWNARTLEYVDKLKRHMQAVMGLVFRQNSLSLYSCSLDRLVLEWDLENMAFVDNLGGHSCGVLGIDALYRPSCITVGGADETVNVYAIEDDKQFQFTSKQVSIDGVKLLNESTFLTHGQDGSVCLWSTNRKRPLQHLKVTHGYIAPPSPEPHWVTAVAALVNRDLAASGSGDGSIRLWRVDIQAHKLFALQRIPIPAGFVNSMEFTPDGTKLVAAIGRTHKQGRWFVNKKAKNCVIVINLMTLKQLRVDGNGLAADDEGSSDEEETTNEREAGIDNNSDEGFDGEGSEDEADITSDIEQQSDEPDDASHGSESNNEEANEGLVAEDSYDKSDRREEIGENDAEERPTRKRSSVLLKPKRR